MICSNSKFILSTQHSKRFYSANFRFFNLNIFSAHRELSTKSGKHNFLTGSDIWGSANNLQRLSLSGIYFCDMKMVRIWMRNALQDLCNYHTCKTSGNFLCLFLRLNLQANAVKYPSQFIRGKIKLNILL